jgi:hypothetical protein
MILPLEESGLTVGLAVCEAEFRGTETPRDPLILGGNHRYLYYGNHIPLETGYELAMVTRIANKMRYFVPFP